MIVAKSIADSLIADLYRGADDEPGAILILPRARLLVRARRRLWNWLQWWVR
jgi:hypothetical protein